MRFKHILAAAFILVVVMVTGASLWYARPYLPLVGIELAILAMVLLGIGIVGSIFLATMGCLTVWHMVEGKRHANSIIEVAQHGSYIRQGSTYIPLMPASVHLAALAPASVPQIAAPRMTVQEVVTPPVVEAPVFKSFADLLSDGTISRAMRQGKLVMGYEQNAITKAWDLRFGSWLDLYSCAVAGVSGSGKTTTVLFLLLQAILAGGKMMIIDPHLADPEESLAARLSLFPDAMIAPACDHHAKEVQRRVRWLAKELARRKGKGIKPPACDRIVFVIDEFNSIMQKGGDLAEELQALLLEIEQEGRKFGLFAMLIGQNWSANSIGDAVIRQCLASALVHRMSEVAQAKKLLPLSKHANSTIELEQGHWLFKDTNGHFTSMYTPYTDEFDGQQVVQYLPVQNVFRPSEQRVNRPEQMLNTPPSLHIVNSVNTEYSPVQYNPEHAEQVLNLQNTTTLGKIAIIEKVWDVKRGGSVAWKQAVAEYEAIIADITVEGKEA